ncbi:MAG: M20/M25/M40 family metallo-hydrolase [Thermoanaerobaculia bacterium]
MRRSPVPSLALLSLCLVVAGPAAGQSLADIYRDEASRILGAALTDVDGWDKLDYLTTEIGHRLSGSPELEEAIDWAVSSMEAEGLENVRRQPVMVPHWVRGEESLEVVAPRPRPLAMLGLGRSVGTPAEGITAPVVVVGDWAELEALPRERVEGRIVVYAVPWEGYGTTVRYRGDGASRAAAKGAVAALVRSATGHSLYTPHTGAMNYDEEQPKIPTAAITPEDAAWLRRMQDHGHEVTLKLVMGAQTLPDAQSANVIAEIVGSEKPEEVVVMGGHFDSWDVGQGAHDDGASCVAAWQALTLLHELGLRPRRTLRVVLWTNEENGLAGGKAYREAVGDAIGDHVAAIEMDMGAERPIGLGFGLAGVDPEGGDAVYEQAYGLLRGLGPLLEGIEAGAVARGGGGADIGPLMCDGVPGLMLQTVGEHYFDWHHTEADTLDKVDPQNLRRAVALLAVAGYTLADMPARLVPEGWRPVEPPERCGE